MRTSVTLDDDVYQLASIYATARGITLGSALGELVRRGSAAHPAKSPSPELERGPNGLLVFKSRGRALTPQMVKGALDDAIE